MGAGGVEEPVGKAEVEGSAVPWEVAENNLEADLSVARVAAEKAPVQPCEADGALPPETATAAGHDRIEAGQNTTPAESDESAPASAEPEPPWVANKAEGGTAPSMEAVLLAEKDATESGLVLAKDAPVEVAGGPTATGHIPMERPGGRRPGAAWVEGAIYARVVGEGEAAAATTINSHIRRLRGRRRRREAPSRPLALSPTWRLGFGRARRLRSALQSSTTAAD